MYQNIFILVLILVLLYLTTKDTIENFQEYYNIDASNPDKLIDEYNLTPKNIEQIATQVKRDLNQDNSLHAGVASFIHPSYVADYIDVSTLVGQKGPQGQKGNTGMASGMRSHEITFSPKFELLRHYGTLDSDAADATERPLGELHKNFIGRFHTSDVVEIYIVFKNDMSPVSQHRTSYFKVTKEIGNDSLIGQPYFRVPHVQSVECDIPVSMYFRNYIDLDNSENESYGWHDYIYELFFDTHGTFSMSDNQEHNNITHQIYLRTSNNPDGLSNESVQPSESQADVKIHPCVKILSMKNYKGRGEDEGDSPLKFDGGTTTVGNLDIKRGIHVQSVCIDDVCLNKDDMTKIKAIA